MGIEASGSWSKDISFQPSNFRELLVILKCIQSFQTELKNSNVKMLQILSDNITSVAYVNKLGGTNKLMCDLMKAIFVESHNLGISISARYLGSHENQGADRLSRILTPYEWQLHPMVFRRLDYLWGPHSIDRFASEMTSQLPCYNSLYFDPRTEGVDALARNWSGENNFINCPFWMLNKVVNKIFREKVAATVITPYWPTQIWFQKLKKMCSLAPIELPNHPKIMLRRSGIPEPLKNWKWKIYAWRISGPHV